MVPTEEVEFLTSALIEVLDLAEVGQVSDGYQYLLSGLHRAEMARDKGEPWGREMVEQWRLAVETYVETFDAVPDKNGSAGSEGKGQGQSGAVG